MPQCVPFRMVDYFVARYPGVQPDICIGQDIRQAQQTRLPPAFKPSSLKMPLRRNRQRFATGGAAVS
jgi:hypothetical protein